MTDRSFSRFSLYGEGNATIAPEFLHIEPISLRSSQYEWTISPHTHPGIFQVFLLERGGALLTADNTATPLQPVTLAVIPSGSIHAFTFDHDAEGWVLSIATALAHELGEGHHPLAQMLTGRRTAGIETGLAKRPARRIAWLMRDIAEDFTQEGAGRLSEPRLAAVTLLLSLCGEVLAGDAPARPVPRGTQARHELLVQRFRDLVDRHFREGWAIPRYAKALGASPPTLTRACKASLGRAPGDLVADRVQLEAMRALTYSAASISRIALDLGFEDPAYFARFFKARTGMTASRFRAERGWFAEGAQTGTDSSAN